MTLINADRRQSVADRLAASLHRTLERRCDGYSFPVFARCIPQFVELLFHTQGESSVDIAAAVRRIVLEQAHHYEAGDVPGRDHASWPNQLELVIHRLLKLHRAGTHRGLWFSHETPLPMFG